MILGANLLEELGQLAAAEAVCRQYVAQSKEPESGLVLAQFLVRRNRFPEALDLCERAWQQCKAETVAAFCAALPLGKLTEEQRQRVSKWLEAASKRTPSPRHSCSIWPWCGTFRAVSATRKNCTGSPSARVRSRPVP